jgi:hypothetical protein
MQKKMSTSGAVYMVHLSEFISPQSIAAHCVINRSPHHSTFLLQDRIFLIRKFVFIRYSLMPPPLILKSQFPTLNFLLLHSWFPSKPLHRDIVTLRTDLDTLRTQLYTLRTQLFWLRTDLDTLRTDIVTLRTDNITLRTDLNTLRTDIF